MFSNLTRNSVVTRNLVRGFSTGTNGNILPINTLAYANTGNPMEVLKYATVPVNVEQTTSKTSTWVVVKQLASPINPADLNLVEGTYGVKAALPAVGGNEGVFEVVSNGPASNLRPGDWVVPVFPGIGTWRSHIVGDSVDFLKVPQVGTPEDVATVMVNPCTAFRMLEDFVHLKSGDVIIQNGATSGVGKAVIQICKARGIKTINIVRDRPNFTQTRSDLMDLGATVVLQDSHLKDRESVAGILQAAGITTKAKLALNCVSGTATLDLVKHLEAGSTIVTYGGMSKKPVMMGTGAFIFNDITLRGFWMTRWSQQHEPTDPERIRMLTALFALIKEGKLKQDHQVFSIKCQDDVIKALEAANAPHKPGKVVLKFNE